VIPDKNPFDPPVTAHPSKHDMGRGDSKTGILSDNELQTKQAYNNSSSRSKTGQVKQLNVSIMPFPDFEKENGINSATTNATVIGGKLVLGSPRKDLEENNHNGLKYRFKQKHGDKEDVSEMREKPKKSGIKSSSNNSNNNNNNNSSNAWMDDPLNIAGVVSSYAARREQRRGKSMEKDKDEIHESEDSTKRSTRIPTTQNELKTDEEYLYETKKRNSQQRDKYMTKEKLLKKELKKMGVGK
jgi:hypothetical protein